MGLGQGEGCLQVGKLVKIKDRESLEEILPGHFYSLASICLPSKVSLDLTSASSDTERGCQSRASLILCNYRFCEIVRWAGSGAKYGWCNIVGVTRLRATIPRKMQGVAVREACQYKTQQFRSVFGEPDKCFFPG